MEYNWIKTDGLLELKNFKILLFGAGKGSEELLHFIQANELDIQISGILDNNETLHGKELFGHQVYDPTDLGQYGQDIIIVTSISGKDAIAKQLEKFDLIHGKDFICIGKYPSGYKNNIQEILSYQDVNSFNGKRCLHIGPGGFFGLELFLYSIGAEQLYSVDKFSFGITGYDITSRMSEYEDVKVYVTDNCRSVQEAEQRRDRFDRAILKSNSAAYIDESVISYHSPVDVEEMPFCDNYFDCVYSFALLEHVEKYEKAIRELFRVTKPGGVQLHTIVTEDHRAFSAFAEFHPFSFRLYSESEWQKAVKNTFHQNRIMPDQWRLFFKQAGFSILDYSVRENLDVDNYDYGNFHPLFKNYSKRKLGEIGCTVYLRKG